MHTVSGEWRGHYAYRKLPDAGCSFSAFFTEATGLLSGSILDDAWPGKATISGTFAYPEIRFTKVYALYKELSAVEYEGTMSDDGKSLSGKWRILEPRSLSVEGTWTAHRFDEETEVLEEVEDSVSTFR